MRFVVTILMFFGLSFTAYAQNNWQKIDYQYIRGDKSYASYMCASPKVDGLKIEKRHYF